MVDLDAADAERLPAPQALKTTVSGVEIPRIPVGRGYAALPLVLLADVAWAAGEAVGYAAGAGRACRHIV